MSSPLDSRKRNGILALLFLATTINYIDRSAIGVLGPTLRDHVFHWTNQDYSYISVSFQLSYAIGLLIAGLCIDRFGEKIGYALSITTWSFFNISHSLIRPSFSLVGFIGARFGLGLGEAGNFPAIAKVIAHWFAPEERAFATGVTNASTNIGAILAPLAIPLLVKPNGDGWQRAFLMTSALSALWLILWLRYYERPPAAAKADLQAERYRWSDVIRHRETWAIALLKTTDAVWWFYIFWGGLFLADRFKLNLNQLGLPLIAIYLFADVGSLGGGWLSGHWLKRGWSTNRARKTVLLICALAVTPIAWATQTDSAWVAVALMALGAAAHQAWSVTLFTIPSDLFPKSALASVAGLGGMVGSGTSVAAFLTLGRILSSNTVGGYFWPFAVASLWYLLVLGCFQWLVPTLSPVQKLAASANQNSTKPN